LSDGGKNNAVTAIGLGFVQALCPRISRAFRVFCHPRGGPRIRLRWKWAAMPDRSKCRTVGARRSRAAPQKGACAYGATIQSLDIRLGKIFEVPYLVNYANLLQQIETELLGAEKASVLSCLGRTKRSRRSRCEELRVICGTRGVPGTVAPFRAWRGSRDLVAQSPKLHAPAVAQSSSDCRSSV
jgi:hypothetical protein